MVEFEHSVFNDTNGFRRFSYYMMFSALNLIAFKICIMYCVRYKQYNVLTSKTMKFQFLES